MSFENAAAAAGAREGSIRSLTFTAYIACSRLRGSACEPSRMSASPRFRADDRPQRTETVAQLREAGGEEGFTDRDAHLSTFRKSPVDPARGLIGVDGEVQVRASYGLELLWRHVVSDELDIRDVHARVDDCVRGARRPGRARRHFLGPHDRGDTPGQVLFVVAERRFAVAPEDQVRVQLHPNIRSFTWFVAGDRFHE